MVPHNSKNQVPSSCACSLLRPLESCSCAPWYHIWVLYDAPRTQGFFTFCLEHPLSSLPVDLHLLLFFIPVRMPFLEEASFIPL